MTSNEGMQRNPVYPLHLDEGIHLPLDADALWLILKVYQEGELDALQMLANMGIMLLLIRCLTQKAAYRPLPGSVLDLVDAGKITRSNAR